MPDPPAMAPRLHKIAEPSMPPGPGRHADGVRPLVDPPPPGGQQRRDVRILHQFGLGRPERDADVGHLDGAAAARPGPLQQPRLQRGERHGPVGPHGIAGCLAGIGVDARRDVDGEDLGPARRGRRLVGAAESRAVGAVDDEIALGQRGPSRGVGRLDHADPGPAARQRGGGHPPVRAVAALAGHHHDAPAVGPAEHAQRRMGDRRPGAPHQCLVRGVGQGGGVRGPHLLAGQTARTRIPSAQRPRTRWRRRRCGSTKRESSPRPARRPARRRCRAGPGRARSGWRPSPGSGAPRRR